MTNTADVVRLKLLHSILNPTRLTRVVDVGANPIGTPPYAALLDAEIVEVWSFEPQEDAFNRLVELQKKNEHPLPYAVGDGHEAELKICQSDGYTSLLEPDPDFGKYARRQRQMTVVERIKMKTKRLDDMDEIEGFDLLKIDIQGGEQAVFRNTPKKLTNALAVITEVAAIALYKDQPLLDQQMQTLRTFGFDLHKFLFFKTLSAAPKSKRSDRLHRRRRKSQLLDGDAAFVRSLLRLEILSDEELKHLALISDSCFQSYDLTLRALHLLEERGAIESSNIDDYVDKIPDIQS